MAPFLERRSLLSVVLGAALPAFGQPDERPDPARRAPAPERFELSSQEVWLQGLDPAHDGLKVAQLSDIHVGRNTPHGRVLAAVRAVNEARPDVVVLTGDYVTTARDPLDQVAPLLAGLEVPAFAVLGNHDHYAGARYLRGALEAIGVTVLQNRHTVARVRGAPLTVLGIDDGQTRRDDVERTFQGAPPSGSRLVLAHTPPTANKLPAWENLLCLSGHTHGGHFVIPKVTESLFRRAGQPYIRGLYQVRGNQLFVNRGLGFGSGGPVVRLNSDPEVSLLTLRRSEQT